MDAEKKSDRVESFVQGLRLDAEAGRGGFDPCYLGYFECFNRGLYYEAHDVLEHLWLRNGHHVPEAGFYKGLIQLAGAFVHLKLQHAHPDHPKHGRRLDPARRLFLLAAANLEPYRPRYQGVDPGKFTGLCTRFAALLGEDADQGGPSGVIRCRKGTVNPWNPDNPPRLSPPEYGR
jgi:predicted metal-dependent hydrolase